MMSLLSDDASYLFSPREEEEEEEGTAGSTCAAAEEDEEEDEKRGEDSEEVDAKRERNARRRTRALDMSLEFVFTNEFVGKRRVGFPNNSLSLCAAIYKDKAILFLTTKDANYRPHKYMNYQFSGTKIFLALSSTPKNAPPPKEIHRTRGLAPRNNALAPSSLTILVPQSTTPLSGLIVHVSVINLVLMTSNGVVTNPVMPPAVAPKIVASARLTSLGVRPRHLA